LFTTTPNKIKNPIKVFALSMELPVSVRPISAPMPASGIENMMTMGKYKDSNTPARIIKMIMMAAKIKRRNH
jgi:peroxiredoxin